MKKISIIAPNALLSNLKHKLEKTKECFENYELDFVLIASKKEKFVFDKTEIILCGSTTKTNDQITMGFKALKETDCAIVCDYNQENYLEYLKMLVSCWEKGAKIVRLQYENERKNIWQKIASFCYKLKMKIYQFMLRVFGMNKYCECYNLFQLFDNEVLDLFKSLPQKNALLRNFDVMKNFYSLTVITNEKLKFKKDKFVWKGTMTASLVLGLLFVGLLVGGILLIPIAREKNNFFTFVCLLAVLLASLLSFSVYYLAVSVLDYKYGANKDKVIVIDESKNASAKQSAEKTAKEGKTPNLINANDLHKRVKQADIHKDETLKDSAKSGSSKKHNVKKSDENKSDENKADENKKAKSKSKK